MDLSRPLAGVEAEALPGSRVDYAFGPLGPAFLVLSEGFSAQCFVPLRFGSRAVKVRR
jgi:hypothetical protein